MCNYQTTNAMREHGMQAVVTKLRVAGAVLPVLPPQKTDFYCDVKKNPWITTGGYLRLPPVQSQAIVLSP